MDEQGKYEKYITDKSEDLPKLFFTWMGNKFSVKDQGI